MYVWRFPVLLFAAFAVTAALLAVTAALIAWRDPLTNRTARAVLLALIAAMLVSSPALVSRAIDALVPEPRNGLLPAYVHPPPAVLWAPAAIVPVLLVALHRLFPGGGAALRYRAACIATLLTLGALNITNFCNPDWCERYGFPFPYSRSSDAIVVVDGWNPFAWFSGLALLGNVAAAALAAVALSRAYRRA